MPRKDKKFSNCRGLEKTRCIDKSLCTYNNGDKYKYCRLSYQYHLDENKHPVHRKTQKRKMPSVTSSGVNFSFLKSKSNSTKNTGRHDSKSKLSKTSSDFDFSFMKKGERESSNMLFSDLSLLPNTNLPSKRGLKRKTRFANRDSSKMYRKQIRKTVKQLKTLCHNADLCLTIGRETQNIKNFFGNFIENKYIKPPIRRIGVPSSNGFVHEIHYLRKGYDAFSILKSTTNASSDNLAYEYGVGVLINHYFNHVVPNFIETYGLFKYINEDAREYVENTSSIMSNVLFSKLQLLDEPSTFQFNNGLVGISCQMSKLMAVMIQNIRNAKTFKESFFNLEKGKLHNNSSKIQSTNKRFKHHIMFVLFQIYAALHIFRKNYTHYDLHSSNVILYIPEKDGYIKFHYHLNNGTVLKFNTHYLPKIIDQGRACISLPDNHFSKNVAKMTCNIQDCIQCGKLQGYKYLNVVNHKSYIQSSEINHSHDLRLLFIIKSLIKSNYRSNIMIQGNNDYEIQLYNLCLRVIYKENYGTPPENNTVHSTKVPSTERISTVSDAFHAIRDILMTEKYQELSNLNEQYYLSMDKFKLADLHIYEDGSPMRWENL
jgi:hypothetical protein